MGFIIKNIFLVFIVSTTIAFSPLNLPLVSNNARFVVFGNVTSFEDLFSVSLNYSDEFDAENDDIHFDENNDDSRIQFEKELNTLNLIEDIEKGDISTPDAKDYHTITKKIDFRRVNRYWQYAGIGGWFLSWLGLWGNMGPVDNEDKKDVENQKIGMLDMCALQFLIHARFKIEAAIRQKSPFRGDKRYMLGYLFNRVRRVLYDQRKVVNAAMMSNKYRQYRKVRALLRLYQQVARYDVDLVDLTRYIRRVYKKPAEFDRYDDASGEGKKGKKKG